MWGVFTAQMFESKLKMAFSEKNCQPLLSVSHVSDGKHTSLLCALCIKMWQQAVMFKAVVGQTDKAGYVAPHHRLQHVQGSSVYRSLFNSKLCFLYKKAQSIHIWLLALNSMFSLFASCFNLCQSQSMGLLGGTFSSLWHQSYFFLNTFSDHCVWDIWNFKYGRASSLKSFITVLASV